MPVLGIVGIVGGATALAGGTLGVLGTIGAIGSIVGGIGALTGNKTLAKIGMVAGLVGGIGAFAQGQGMFGAGGSAVTPPNPFAEGAGASAIDAMQAAPSGAEFNLNGVNGNGGLDGGGFDGGAGSFGGDIVPPTGPLATEGLGGGDGSSIVDSIGEQAPGVSDALGGESSTASLAGGTDSPFGGMTDELMGSDPAPAPGLFNAAKDSQLANLNPMESSPLQDAMSGANPLAEGGGFDQAMGGGGNPLYDGAAGGQQFGAPPANPAESMGLGVRGNQGLDGGGFDAATGTFGAQAPGNKILDTFNKFFRNPDGKLNNDMMSMALKFVGGALQKPPGQREQTAEEADFLRARTESERTQAEILRQQAANGNAVPNMNFGLQRKPGGPFRPTSPTFNPVRMAPTGGLFNAR